MKNNAKRLLAFLLAALLCVTMVVPAFATETEAVHDHEHKVSCDDNCTHECETKHANSEVIEVVESVCTAAGYTLKYCFDCEHYFVADVVPAKEGAAHNPGDKKAEGKAPTCVSEGIETSYVCTVCGAECDKDGGEVDKLEEIDHEYKDGLCVICGDHESDACIGEHEWEFVEVTVEATATTNGTATYKCKECGAKKEVVIKATSGEAERIYPSSIYVDVDFANGVATDRLGNATLTNKGEVVIGKTDVTYNGTELNVDALTVNKSGTWVMGTLSKLDTAEKMDAFLAGGFSLEALYLDNSSVAAGIICITEASRGWAIAHQKNNKEAQTDRPYFITGNGSGYNSAYPEDKVSDTELVHVVGVYNPTEKTHSIYVNGELAGDATKNVPGVVSCSTTTSKDGIAMFNVFCLGADLSPKTDRDGDFLANNLILVDAKIYASALTAEEVKMLHGYVVEDFTEKEVVDELAWVKEILAEKNLKFEDYDVLTLDTQLAGYYNSNSATLSTIVTKPGDAFTSSYWCTKTLYTANEIPAGSILLVKEGYQYRPEGWKTLDTQNTGKNGAPARPANVTDEFTVIGADFWSTFVYRSFNISRVVAKDANGDYIAMTEDDLGAFVILTPKTHTCSKDTLTAKAAVAGTCTEKGTIAHYECSCGKLYADAEATKLITSIEGDFGHTYDLEKGPTASEPAICDKYGYELWACELCGDVKAENIPPKGHANWDDEDRATNVVTEKATCTKPGKITWTCDCGKAMEETLKATGCTLVTVEVAATCYTFAFKYTYCKNATCDETEVKVTAPYFATADGKYAITNVANVVAFEITGTEYDADNHYHIATDIVKEAKCEEDGIKVDYCLGCHKEDKTYTYSLNGHNYGEGVVTTPADCHTAKVTTYTCKDCGYVKVVTGDKLAHTLGEEVKTENATCAADGRKYKVCTACGDEVTIEVLKYETVAEEGIYKNDADMTKDGAQTGFDKAMAEHSLDLEGVIHNYREGTCTLVGLDKYTCKDCKKDILVQNGVGGGNHEWTDTEDKAADATCTEDGYVNAKKCDKCGETRDGYVVKALGHKLTEVVAKEETCEEDGDVAHFHCDTCGKNFKDAEGKEEITDTVVIPATGHNYVAGVCTNCGEKCAHKYAPIASNVASCDEDALYDGYGFTHFACSECGDEYWMNFVVTPAHDYKEGEIVKKPNCTTEGKKADVCKECGKETNVVVLPETHYNAKEEAIIDSCIDTTEDRVCVVCTETIGKSHNPVTTKVNNTCKELGYTITACGDCGEVLETVANAEFGDHVGPKWDNPVIVESTYTKEGTSTKICELCGHNEVTTLEKKSGLNIELVATNKYSFKEYVDGSFVTVKVVVDANNINMWSFKFTVNYNETVLNFVEGAVAEEMCGVTTGGVVNAKDGVATIIGFASNDKDGKMQNVALNGEDVVVATLVFRVDSTVETEAEFTVDVATEGAYKIVDKAGEDAEAAVVTKGAKISTQLYLDINNDTRIDIEDLNAMVQIMTDEVPADAEIITAAGDVNHDGEIGEKDLELMLDYLVGAKTYAQVIGK